MAYGRTTIGLIACAVLLACAKQRFSTASPGATTASASSVENEAAAAQIAAEPTRDRKPPSSGVCGDGVVQNPETCDDGNIVLGDGCSERCRAEARLITSGEHVCVLLVTGDVKCWGPNGVRQLGYGDTKNRGAGPGEMGDSLPVVSLGTGRKAIDLAARGAHTCALLDDHSVKCWGLNDVGQLGYGDVNNRGDGPGEMGDALPRVDLGVGRTARSLALGAKRSCAILDNGTVKCWGEGVSYNRAGHKIGGDSGDAPDEMGDNLATVDLGRGYNAKQLSAGDLYACAILGNGRVKCWGAAVPSTLGYGKKSPNRMGDGLPYLKFGLGRVIVALSAGSAHTCAIFGDGSVGCWGDGSFGQLGDRVSPNDCEPEIPMDPLCRSTPPRETLNLGGRAVQIEARFNSTCVLLDGGSLKCWGANRCAQFGGDSSAPQCTDGLQLESCIREVPTEPMHIGLNQPVESVSLTSGNICVLFHDHRIKCWGCYNKDGDLGYGDTKPRPKPTDEFVEY